MPVNDHVTLGLATKFPDASRVMAYTGTELPEATLGDPTAVPLPSAAVSTVRAAAVPAVTVKVPELPVRDGDAKTAWTVAVPFTWPVKSELAPLLGDKSVLTTPPVMPVNDHVTLGLPTKFPDASRVMAYTGTELPEATLGDPTAVPLPSAAVSTVRAAAVPAVTVKVPELPVRDGDAKTAWTVAVPFTWPVKSELAPLLGDKSVLTTPPVMPVNDHVTLGLPTKFPDASRVMAYTGTELPEATLGDPTAVPLPSAAVSTVRAVAVPALTASCCVPELSPLPAAVIVGDPAFWSLYLKLALLEPLAIDTVVMVVFPVALSRKDFVPVELLVRVTVTPPEPAFTGLPSAS
jgi:hypothetical protein